MTRNDSRRWWILMAFVPATLAIGLDATVITIALPTLGAKLHASTGQMQWFVAAYTLVFAAAMVPGGMLGDRYGRKKVLLVALTVFGLGSLACAFAGSAGVFISARMVLGLGAAVVTPMVLGALPALFTDEERPKAIAAIMAVTILGYPLGPILGGWLLSHFWWGWVFLMNVPVVVLALVAVMVFLPESREPERPRLDGVGVVVSSAGLAVLTYGMIEAGQHGWGNTVALAEMIGGLVAIGAFVLWERSTADSLIDLELFRSRGFTWGTILTTVLSFAMFGLIWAVPLFFQEVTGVDAMGSGLRLLPMIGGLIVSAGIGPKLAARAGARVPVALGFVFVAVALGIGTTTTVASSEAFMAVWITLCGLGMGFSMPTAMDAALGALSPERSGVGSGTIQALRMVGGTFGAAVLGSVVNTVYLGRLDTAGLPGPVGQAVRGSVVSGVETAHKLHSGALLASVQGSFVHGMDVMLWIAVAVAAAAVLLALAFLPGREKKSSPEAAARPEFGHELG
jgi:DHA2 family multidrug resistance protein-like MFS transporter